MASSSSTSSRKPKRTVKQYVRRKTTDRRQSTSSSSTGGTDSTAPTYRVEENSDGELVNKQLGVKWPARAPRAVKRYPDYSSGQSTVPSSDGEDQFRTSPYEMISIADLDEAIAKSREFKRDLLARQKAFATYKPDDDDDDDDRYIDLFNTGSKTEMMSDHMEGADELWNESPTNIDSVVFDTAEELACYQRVIGASLRKEKERKEREKMEEVVEKDEKEKGEEEEEKEKKEKKEKKAKKEERKPTVESTTQTEPEEDTAPATTDQKTARDDADKHYIGVRSRRAVDKKLTPGQFFMYYEKPPGGEIPVTIELKIGYMSSTNKIYHFPIQRFECQGESYYAVMQTDTDMKMFPSISALVQHYHTFSHVDPETGRLETFGLPV